MNRIRYINGEHQVLVTPENRTSPSSSIINFFSNEDYLNDDLGLFDDGYLKSSKVLFFNNLSDAQYEALKYPDIDWKRITMDHKHIYHNLKSNLQSFIDKHNFSVYFEPKLLSSYELKNSIFDRVLLSNCQLFNDQFVSNNLCSSFNIISFKITNPFTKNIYKISKILKHELTHYFRDDFRIRHHQIVDGCVIVLYGYTELGTVYEIKLMPCIVDHWCTWFKNNFSNNYFGKEYIKQQSCDNKKNNILNLQKTIDKESSIF